MARFNAAQDFYLGKLCPRGHDHEGSGQSRRSIGYRTCVECNRIKSHEWAIKSRGTYKFLTEEQKERRRAANQRYVKRLKVADPERILEKHRKDQAARDANPKRAAAARAQRAKRWREIKADPLRVEKARSQKMAYYYQRKASDLAALRADKKAAYLRRIEKDGRDHINALCRASRERRLLADPEKVRRQSKETVARYWLRHRDEILAKNRDRQKRRGHDRVVMDRLRARLTAALNAHSSGGKVKRSREYGVDFVAILKYIGPCPGDRSEMEIDHLISVCWFSHDDPEQIKLAWAPENHRWLSRSDNRKKSFFIPSICPPGLERQYEVAVRNGAKKQRAVNLSCD